MCDYSLVVVLDNVLGLRLPSDELALSRFHSIMTDIAGVPADGCTRRKSI